MDAWEKERAVELVQSCIQRGDFTLHSGETSDWICDLLTARTHFRSLMAMLQPNYPTVGIELGGLLLTEAHGGSFIRKDGTHYSNGYQPKKVSLVDDVVTTETSMTEAFLALDKLGIEVGEYLCILDRREPANRILAIRSLVTTADLQEAHDELEGLG